MATTRSTTSPGDKTARTAGQKLSLLNAGSFVTLVKVQPAGSLQARKQQNGAVAFFWRYTISGKSERVAIGIYDSAAPPKSWTPTTKGYSVAAAVHAAETLAQAHHAYRENGGRPALVRAQQTAETEAGDAAARARAEARTAAEHTLERLLDHYVAYLKKIGRTSYRDAQSIFNRHIKEPWPEIAGLPAKDVTGEHINNMMRRLSELDKGRTSNKLRSYVRAAYQTARAARSKAAIPAALKEYEITSNPAMDTMADESKNLADRRPLSENDLRAYWKQIQRMDGFKGAVLRLHVLTGGQRIQQLVKLRTADVEIDQMTLFDGKGRPGKADRPHQLPLTQATKEALATCASTGTYAISTDGGTTHLAATTLSKWAKEAAVEACIVDFQAKRVRSGVETLLAKSGVPREIRGRLQSHGISGVQARHYDGHDYMPEKLMALETLHVVLSL